LTFINGVLELIKDRKGDFQHRSAAIK